MSADHPQAEPGFPGTAATPRAYTPVATRPKATGWVGWIGFAGAMMVLVGMFNLVMGLVALFEEEYYVIGPEGLLVFDLTTWGWIHLISGILSLVAGWALFTGATWARVVAVVLAGLSAVAHLVSMSTYPWWNLIVVALDVLVIWAVIVHGDEVKGVV